MGLFNYYLLTEAGLSPADKRMVDNLTHQIQTIDKQLQLRIGPTGKGKLMQQSGEYAGHINDKDPQYIALTQRRALLVAKKNKLMGNVEN